MAQKRWWTSFKLQMFFHCSVGGFCLWIGSGFMIRASLENMDVYTIGVAIFGTVVGACSFYIGALCLISHLRWLKEIGYGDEEKKEPKESSEKRKTATA